MKGTDCQIFRLLRLFQQFRDAFLHLRCGLVGEGERGDMPGFIAAVFDQVRDFLRDHARLAGTGASQHQTWAIHVFDGFTLRGVETKLRGR